MGGKKERRQNRTLAHEKRQNGAPASAALLPAEDDDIGAESVVSLVRDESGDAQDAHDAHGACWRQVEADEGPGTYEREMALIRDMHRTGTGTGHKRSVDELDTRGGMPPKRVRTDRGVSLGPESASAYVAHGSSVRLVKRRSEELDADDDLVTKRARRAQSPPGTNTVADNQTRQLLMP
ncbi:hypothetical protein B0H19DRAFT_1083561 [Mycena capillaripes]|nr:hypothetical protein B0H19DRAFT_1083561 [Mycena capillaripes]